MRSKFNIKGLDCANCAAELERTLQKIDGINNASINFITEKMEIEHEEQEDKEFLEKLKKVIKKEEPDVTIEKI